MARPKNTDQRKPVTTALNKKLMENLRKYSEESGINMNRIIEKALEEYLKDKIKGEE